MDEVIPFGMEKVVAALHSAMEDAGCKVTDANASRIECKRGRGSSERTGSGGEKVTATLEAKGEQARVRIWTGKGTLGRIWEKELVDSNLGSKTATNRSPVVLEEVMG